MTVDRLESRWMNLRTSVFHEWSLNEVSVKAELRLISKAFWMSSTQTVQACRGLNILPAHLVSFNKYG